MLLGWLLRRVIGIILYEIFLGSLNNIYKIIRLEDEVGNIYLCFLLVKNGVRGIYFF